MRVLKTATICIAVLLATGFAGALHPIGDSFAVLRVPLSVGLGGCALLIGIIGRKYAIAFAIFLAAIFGVMTTRSAAPHLENSATPQFVVYQKNLLRRGKDRSEFQAEVLAIKPDFLMTQEISPRNRNIFAAFKEILPSQHICEDARGLSGVGVASRFPVIEGQRWCEGPVAAMQVETPQGPVWVISAHWDWPFPFSQANSFEATRTLMTKLSGPIVMSGDLNIVPWAYAPQKIASEFGLQRIGPNLSSFYLLGYWPITIDHVFATGQGSVDRRPLLGSDHYGLLAKIGLK